MPGLFESVFAERDAALECLLAERAIVLIAEEPARRGIARDVDVGPAVVVVVGRRQRSLGTTRAAAATPDCRLTSVNVPSPLL